MSRYVPNERAPTGIEKRGCKRDPARAQPGDCWVIGMAPLLSLLAAGSIGAAGFLGGLATKRSRVLTVAFFSNPVGPSSTSWRSPGSTTAS
jgi:hypothetical protein